MIAEVLHGRQDPRLGGRGTVRRKLVLGRRELNARVASGIYQHHHSIRCNWRHPGRWIPQFSKITVIDADVDERPWRLISQRGVGQVWSLSLREPRLLPMDQSLD